MGSPRQVYTLLLVLAAPLAWALSNAPQSRPPPKFDNIYNWRRVCGGVYRAAALEQANACDVEVLSQQLGIKTVIDLRGQDERSALASSPVAKLYPEQYEPGAITTSTTRRMYHISLLQTDRYYAAIYSTWPPLKKVYASVLSAVSGKAETALYIDTINDGGLLQLYILLLTTAQDDICRALQIIADKGWSMAAAAACFMPRRMRHTVELARYPQNCSHAQRPNMGN
jgi:Tyrosine phosphatase family